MSTAYKFTVNQKVVFNRSSHSQKQTQKALYTHATTIYTHYVKMKSLQKQ